MRVSKAPWEVEKLKNTHLVVPWKSEHSELRENTAQLLSETFLNHIPGKSESHCPTSQLRTSG